MIKEANWNFKTAHGEDLILKCPKCNNQSAFTASQIGQEFIWGCDHCGQNQFFVLSKSPSAIQLTLINLASTLPN